MEAMDSKTAAGRMPPHNFLFLDFSTGTSFCLYLDTAIATKKSGDSICN